MRPLLIAVAGIALIAGCGIQVVPAAEAPPVNGDPVVSAQVAEPVSLTIPALGVTDEVVPVGICDKKVPPRCEKGIGEMELPDISETGWYKLAPKPGEPGRAVLLSHVDWEGTPGAFKHLPNLKLGDTFTTRDAAGGETKFVVYDTQQILKVDFQKTTVPLLFGKSTGEEAALVTCSGTVRDGNYDKNTVVRARAVT